MPRRAAFALLLAAAAISGCNRESNDGELSRSEKAAQQLEPAAEPDPLKTGTAAIAEAANTGVDSGEMRAQATGRQIAGEASGTDDAAAGENSDGRSSTDPRSARRSLSDLTGESGPSQRSLLPSDRDASLPPAAVPAVEELDRPPNPTADVTSGGDNSIAPAAGSNTSTTPPANLATFAAFGYPDRPHELKADDWIAYLAEADQAMQQAIAAQTTEEIDRAAFLETARRISNYKLSAAEALVGAASMPQHDELAVLGKIEALSQLAGLGDRSRASELLSFAAQKADFASDDVARRAAIVLLSFSLNRVSGGLSDPGEVLSQVDAALRAPQGLRLPEYIMMERTIETLQRQGLNDAAEQVRQKTAQAFMQSADASLAMRAWRLGVEGSEQLRSFQEAVSQPRPDERPLTAAVEGLITAYPTQWTLAALASEIRNLEYAGKSQAARVIAEAVQRRSNLLNSAELRREVGAELDAWRRRVDLMNRRPPLTGLVNAEGSPVRIEDFDGKYTLIDFWASWCPTCREEFDRIEAAVAELGPRLQVVGVNLDANPEAMQSVIDQAKLQWPQLRVDAPAGEQPISSPNMAEIGVRSLPFNLLLDPQGRVIASQLHGDAMLERLRELLPQS